MAVTISCPGCRREAAVPEDADLQFPCPHCQQPIHIPVAARLEEPTLNPMGFAPGSAAPPPSPFQFSAPADEPDDPVLVAPRYPAAAWKWVRSGLTCLTGGVVVTLLAHGGIFLAIVLGSFLVGPREDTPAAVQVLKLIFGVLDALGLITGLAGIAMTCTIPPRSRLRGRAIAALSILTLAPLGVVVLTQVPAVVPDVGLRAGSILILEITAVIGVLLYLLFLRDLSMHLGAHKLGDALFHYLIQLVMCLIGLPVLIIGSYSLAMVLIGGEFFLRQGAVMLIIGGIGFAAVALLHLRFLQLLLQVRGRLDEVVR